MLWDEWKQKQNVFDATKSVLTGKVYYQCLDFRNKGYNYSPIRTAKSRTLTPPNSDKVVEQKKSSYTASRNAK